VFNNLTRGRFMWIFWVQDHEVTLTTSGTHGDCSNRGTDFWPQPFYRKWIQKITCPDPKFSSCHTHSQMCRHTEIQLFFCLGITDKCINSYQFIISFSCSCLFLQLCAILRKLVCTFWVTCQFGFLVHKILCSMCLCMVAWQAVTRNVQKVQRSFLQMAHSSRNK
jgi:hypothetical protein